MMIYYNIAMYIIHYRTRKTKSSLAFVYIENTGLHCCVVISVLYRLLTHGLEMNMRETALKKPNITNMCLKFSK